MTPRKPHRNAFLMGATLFPVILWTMMAVVAGVIGVLEVGAWVGLAAAGVWGLLVVVTCVLAVARYRKERYEVHDDRIVVYRGGLMSDEELEVHYPKITHVKWVRPWLRHKLFGVGHVFVEVAGSGAGSIALQDITESEAAQLEIRSHMHQAFSMRTDELLHEESPSGRAILLDVPIKSGWALMIGIIGFGAEFVPMLHDMSEAGLDKVVSISWLLEHAAWLLLAVPVAAIWMMFLALRCLDLKHRSYRVYNGVIEYHEGFLTRNDAFMPVENLSNSEVTRGIVERIANVHNVVVSCQGTGQQVAFLYLRRGPALNQVLDELIDQAQTAAEAAETSAVSASVAAAAELADGAESPVVPAEPPPLPREITCPDLAYRMHLGRSLTGKLAYLLLAPIYVMVPPLLLYAIYRLVMEVIRIVRTNYKLRHGSVEEHYEFIRVEQREFSRDKITGVVFRENLFDRLFGTITIQFWSIGSGKEIIFRNVLKTDELIAAVHQRFGISGGEPKDVIASKYGFLRFLSSNLALLIFDGVLILGSVVLAVVVKPSFGYLVIALLVLPVLGYLWGIFFYRQSKLELHEKGMMFRRGIITRTKTWAKYDNVKDVTTMKMPGFDAGAIRFNVAGERMFGNNATPIPYGFTVQYVPDVESKDERFDYEILSRKDVTLPAEEEVVEARKALRNTLVRTLLICIIIFPLIALLPIILPIVLYRASLVRYRIEPGRVLMRQGHLFRQQTSILFDRIDHVQTSQGAIHKLCGAGNISISTAGSTNAELVLRDVIDHEAFYRALRDHHRADKNPPKSPVAEPHSNDHSQPETRSMPVDNLESQ